MFLYFELATHRPFCTVSRLRTTQSNAYDMWIHFFCRQLNSTQGEIRVGQAIRLVEELCNETSMTQFTPSLKGLYGLFL